MLIKVQELVSRQQPIELEGTLDMTDLFRDHPEYRPLTSLSYDLVAQAADDRILVSGQLSCNVQMQCSRCLDNFNESMLLPYEEQFRVVSDVDVEASEEEDAIPVTEERIDLSPYLVEELVVQLPYAPLCSDDCKGLCPECGTNLNEQSCGCNTEKLDPRMAALQDWFKSQKE